MITIDSVSVNIDGHIHTVTQGNAPMQSPAVPTHTVKKWGDPRMVELMGYDTNLTGGNFQVFALFTPTGEFGAVQQFQILDATAMTLLRSLQTSDDNMNWLCSDGEGRPYFTEGGTWKNGGWTRFLFGTLVFGGQKIAVEMSNGLPVEYVFNSKYKAESGGRHPITFYKLLGLRRADIPLVNSGVISHASHPHLIQKGTAANAGGGGNVYTEYPGNEKYHPVWSPLDWSSNNGNALYVAKEFVF